ARMVAGATVERCGRALEGRGYAGDRVHPRGIGRFADAGAQARRSGLAAPPVTASGAGRRPVRSFVLRQGRMSPAQQRALDDLLPRHGVAYTPRALDLPALFGRPMPVVL